MLFFFTVKKILKKLKKKVIFNVGKLLFFQINGSSKYIFIIIFT